MTAADLQFAAALARGFYFAVCPPRRFICCGMTNDQARERIDRFYARYALN